MLWLFHHQLANYYCKSINQPIHQASERANKQASKTQTNQPTDRPTDQPTNQPPTKFATSYFDVSRTNHPCQIELSQQRKPPHPPSAPFSSFPQLGISVFFLMHARMAGWLPGCWFAGWLAWLAGWAVGWLASLIACLLACLAFCCLIFKLSTSFNRGPTSGYAQMKSGRGCTSTQRRG